jgi:hypothetical protein
MVGTLEEKSAAYIAGYVLKKILCTPCDTSRVPPFARMSLKPGIGAGAIPDVASVMMQLKLEEKLSDVPGGLRHGNNIWPLGRYLRRLLRQQVGLPVNAPEATLEALRQGLLPVFEYAAANAKGSSDLFDASLKAAFLELNGDYNWRLANRKPRGTI